MNSPRIVDRVEQRPVSTLSPYLNNTRTHSESQIDQIMRSIERFGFVNPILVGSDSVIVAGHARVRAAERLGMETVPVIVLGHLSTQERRALSIADNQLALNAAWDEDLLRAELASLRDLDFDLACTGFAEEDLARLLEEQDLPPGQGDEEAIPEITPAVSVTGDLWELGPHRLLCGDATMEIDRSRLLEGDKAALAVTDPPYNVAYEGFTPDHLTMRGDRMKPDQFRQFLDEVFGGYRAVLEPEASLYVFHASNWQREVQSALEEAGFSIRCQIIWAKNQSAWGFGRYKYQHEPIFYCHRSGQQDRWYGDRCQSTLWEENKPVANRQHPTAKPIQLLERAIRNSSRRGDLVVDLFGGSGATLIACERLGRRSSLMEIDPQYADVIIRRYEQFTGKAAVLQGDGRSFREIARARLAKAA
jgi:DNA modification methylase